MGILRTAGAGVLTLTFGLASPQGGFGGGGFGGGGLGGYQGAQQQQLEMTVRGIQQAIDQYLTGEETKSILTPGEFTEWPLKMKAGQVLIAEARSDAFDPALQVVDEKNEVLGMNDDRFPGDQRPLLLWRCGKTGTYKLRGRCFRDKAGGQMFLRSRTYESLDLGDKPTAKGEFSREEPFLIRVSMKAGQLKRLETARNLGYDRTTLSLTLSPLGLPDVNLAAPLNKVAPYVVFAPVAGDYYVIARATYMVEGAVEFTATDLAPEALVRTGDRASDASESKKPKVWTLALKAGDILRAEVPGLSSSGELVVLERPDVSTFDLKKDETNPFYPKVTDREETLRPALAFLPGRERDPRVKVFAARKDTVVWLATDGESNSNQPFTISVQSAVRPLADGKAATSTLQIGGTDYWSIEAKVGDVLTYRASASGFLVEAKLFGPDFEHFDGTSAHPDESAAESYDVISRPGRLLLAVSSVGDGGGGPYEVSRSILSPQDIIVGSKRSGELKSGQVHVLKFAATPDRPVLARLGSSNWDFVIAFHDAEGAMRPWLLEDVGGNQRFGILKVDKPTIFLVVLSFRSRDSTYEVELSDLPGFVKGESRLGGGRGEIFVNGGRLCPHPKVAKSSSSRS